MKRTITVTHEDLDRALSATASDELLYTCSCMIAQAGKRQGFSTRLTSLAGLPVVNSSDLFMLTWMFDATHRSDGDMFLAMLEAVLPMEIEIEHD